MLKKIAEKIEIGLLNKVANQDIVDYDVNVISDDNKIEVILQKDRPIKFDLKLAKDFVHGKLQA